MLSKNWGWQICLYGFFTQRHAHKVSDENLTQAAFGSRPPEHSVTHGAERHQRLGAAADGIVYVFGLHLGGQCRVNLDESAGAAERLFPLILSLWPLHADQVENLVHEDVLVRCVS